MVLRPLLFNRSTAQFGELQRLEKAAYLALGQDEAGDSLVAIDQGGEAFDARFPRTTDVGQVLDLVDLDIREIIFDFGKCPTCQVTPRSDV